jgi:vacuolar-type H+-ATPase subunit I/STV1
MTRVFIAGPADNQEETMRFLQEFGVVHVEPATEMAGEYEKKNAALLVSVKKLDQVITGVQRFRDRKTAAPHPLTIADEELVSYAEERLSALQEMESRVSSLERLKVDLSLWGKFDLAQIRALEEAGVCVRRFRMETKKWQQFEPPGGLLLEVTCPRPRCSPGQN